MFWVLLVLWLIQTVVVQIQKSNSAAMAVRNHNEILGLLEKIAEQKR